MNAKQLMGTLMMLTASTGFAVSWQGGDGKWSDPLKWSPQQVPSASDAVSFDGSIGGRVELDGSGTAKAVYVYSPEGRTEPTEPEDTLTLWGDGSLSVMSDGSQGAGSFNVYAGRRLLLESGYLKVKNLNLSSGSDGTSVFEMNGGVLEMGASVSRSSGGIQVFTQNAGTIISDATGSFRLFSDFHTNDVATIGGDLYVTNAVESCFFLKNQFPKLLGGGRIFSSGFFVVKPGSSGSSNRMTFDLSAICLGGYSQGFYFNESGETQIDFKRNFTFGAFADWEMPTSELRHMFNFEKGLTVDTTDCFDHETPHTVTLKSVKIFDWQPLAVLGTGTAVVNVRNMSAAKLSDFSIAAGATLTLTNCSFRARRFEMGAGATLNITAKAAAIEADEEDVDPTAAINVTIPANITSGTTVIYSSSRINSVAAKCIRIVGDNPKNLKLVTVGGCTVLTDGVQTIPTTEGYWTGRIDGLMSKVGNWGDEKLPPSSGPVYLGSTENTFMTNDYNTSVGSVFKAVRIRTASVKRPYVITGDPIQLTGGVIAGANSPIYNGNACPFYLDAQVSRSGSGAFSVMQASDSFTVFSRAETFAVDFHPAGDVRIAGTLTCPQLVFDSPSGISRPTGLKVLDGGVACIANQESGQTNGTFRVNEAGLLEIQQGVWQWSFACTNVIDGKLVLGAVPSGDVPLFFGGSGEIVLTNAALGAWAQSPVFAGSHRLTLAGDRSFGTLRVADDATLTLDANGHALTLTEPISGGTVAFAAGETLALGGALAAAAEKDWATIATVSKDFVAPEIEGYRTRVVDGAFQAKRISGLIMIFR